MSAAEVTSAHSIGIQERYHRKFKGKLIAVSGIVILRSEQLANIADEIERYRISCYEEAGREPPLKCEFSDVLLQQEKETRAKTTDGLQPWLAILEFGIEWLIYVHIALSDEDSIGPRRPSFRTPWALIGSAVSFGLSIRSLSLFGLDTPARALLRSYTETLFLCLAILDDKKLAQIFENADDDTKIKNFWHESASPKNLHKKIMDIERRAGLDEDAVIVMKNWRQQEYEILSQSTHLSYLAACLTAVTPILGGNDELCVGIMGAASESSVRTIFYAAATTWYFSRFGYNFLIGNPSSKNLLIVDTENDWHLRIVVGREVLARITMAHWGE